VTLTLSMVMIARNERANVAPCFEGFWPYVDEVVLCDTGSRDGTVAEARRYAKARGEAGKLIIGRFKWVDDFAAARTYAHSLADRRCSRMD
jgi:glycosyltransferase involved in cell wall biosynthesis